MSLERDDTQRAEASVPRPPQTQTSVPDAEPLVEVRRLEPGTTVGRYKVRRILGQGGMGVVYLAEDPQLGRLVAMKLLRPAMGAEGEEHQRRLLREAQVLARVSHRNLVTVYDVGVHEGMVFVAMEYVKGVTLDAWRRATQRRWPEILDKFIEAAGGLIAVHEAGLVHRDFKPGNVMVAEDGRVLLLDFGLARATLVPATEGTDDEPPVVPEGDADDDDQPHPVEEVASPTDDALRAELTRAGGIMGTPAYMAPEQHLALEADARADQFSFCVALYEALYDDRPFWGRDPVELMESALRGLSALPEPLADLPLEVRRALHRGLQADRDARFPTMHELLVPLREAIATTKPRRSWRLIFAATLLVGLTAAVTWRLAQDPNEGAADDAGEETSTVTEAAEGAAIEADDEPPHLAPPPDEPTTGSVPLPLPGLGELPPPAEASTGSADTDSDDAPGTGGAGGTVVGPPIRTSTSPLPAADGGALPGILEPDAPATDDGGVDPGEDDGTPAPPPDPPAAPDSPGDDATSG